MRANKKTRSKKRTMPVKPRKPRRIRHEDPKLIWFITAKTANDRLWFVNNKLLEEKILAWLAKFATTYNVQLFSFKLMGNHYHLVARFPRANRGGFMKAFNSQLARLVKAFVPKFEGGQLIKPKYYAAPLLSDEDVLHWSLYVWLNAVSTGLVANIREDNCYNSFADCAQERKRDFELVNWGEYRQRKRSNRKVKAKEFTETYTLSYLRLPGMEKLSHGGYCRALEKALAKRREEYLEERREARLGFAGREYLRSIVAGSKPKNPKTSNSDTHKPLVLTLDAEAREQYIKEYFELVDAYYSAANRYARGERHVRFPKNTYLPSMVLNC